MSTSYSPQSDLAVAQSSSVPTGYAEKAMASLMQLHSELMEEKEKRVDLFRRLMEKEQALAELKMYVKVLEEKQAALMPPPVPRETLKVAPRPGPAPIAPPAPVAVAVAPAVQAPPAQPPVVPQVARIAPTVRSVAAPAPDGWKTW